MPKKYGLEDSPEDVTKQRRACDGLREDLKQCLVESDCVQHHRRSPKECLMLRGDPSVPEQCHLLRISFFECKRSMLDMRTRFRGRKGY